MASKRCLPLFCLLFACMHKNDAAVSVVWGATAYINWYVRGSVVGYHHLDRSAADDAARGEDIFSPAVGHHLSFLRARFAPLFPRVAYGCPWLVVAGFFGIRVFVDRKEKPRSKWSVGGLRSPPGLLGR